MRTLLRLPNRNRFMRIMKPLYESSKTWAICHRFHQRPCSSTKRPWFQNGSILRLVRERTNGKRRRMQPIMTPIMNCLVKTRRPYMLWIKIWVLAFIPHRLLLKKVFQKNSACFHLVGALFCRKGIFRKSRESVYWNLVPEVFRCLFQRIVVRLAVTA